jgi:hypothetical protein
MTLKGYRQREDDYIGPRTEYCIFSLNPLLLPSTLQKLSSGWPGKEYCCFTPFQTAWKWLLILHNIVIIDQSWTQAALWSLYLASCRKYDTSSEGYIKFRGFSSSDEYCSSWFKCPRSFQQNWQWLELVTLTWITELWREISTFLRMRPVPGWKKFEHSRAHLHIRWYWLIFLDPKDQTVDLIWRLYCLTICPIQDHIMTWV